MPVAMPTEQAPQARNDSRKAKKRRRSEVEESDAQIAPDAKRVKEEVVEDSGNAIRQQQTNETKENGDGRPSSATSNEKKKRKKKKKKKVSVVGPHTASSTEKLGQALSGQLSPAASSSKHSSREVHSTPGPSRLSRSPNPKPARGDANPTQQASSVEASTSTSNKGKERARAVDLVDPPAQAPASNAVTEAKLASHRALLASMAPSLTCQICLFLMTRPFALAPCGHTSCYSCLVNWFTGNPPEQAPDEPANQVAIIQPPPLQPAHNGPALGPNQVPIAVPPANGLPHIPLPFVPLPPTRKKTCPHCRAVVHERPVEVWAIKDMVNTLIRSELAETDSVPTDAQDNAAANSNAAAPGLANDPWKDIFPPKTRGGAGGINGPLGAIMLRESLGIFDEEDGGVYRCVDCAHEIWDGVCSDCGRIYPGHHMDEAMLEEELLGGGGSEDEDEDDYFPLPWAFPQFYNSDDSDPDAWGSDYSGSDSSGSEPHGGDAGGILVGMEIADEGGDEVNSEDEESYESSFIDDGDEGQQDSDEPNHPPERRRPRRSSQHPQTIIISSDEESEDENFVPRSFPSGRARIPEVEDGDGDDDSGRSFASLDESDEPRHEGAEHEGSYASDQSNPQNEFSDRSDDELHDYPSEDEY